MLPPLCFCSFCARYYRYLLIVVLAAIIRQSSTNYPSRQFSLSMDGLHFEPISAPSSPTDSFSSISIGSPCRGPPDYNSILESLFQGNCSIPTFPSPLPTLPALAHFESIGRFSAADILCTLATGSDETGRMNSLPQPIAPSYFTTTEPARSLPERVRTYTTLLPPTASSTPVLPTTSSYQVTDFLPIPTNTEAVLWYNRAQLYRKRLEKTTQACKSWELKYRRHHMGAGCSRSCKKCHPTSPTTKP